MLMSIVGMVENSRVCLFVDAIEMSLLAKTIKLRVRMYGA